MFVKKQKKLQRFIGQAIKDDLKLKRLFERLGRLMSKQRIGNIPASYSLENKSLL